MGVLKINILLFLLVVCTYSLVQGQQIKQSIPRSAEKRYEKAQAKLRHPSPHAREEALELLKEAVLKAPHFFNAYALMGSLYNRMQDYSLSVEFFDKANAIDSQRLLKGYNSYAHAAAGMGEFSKAIGLLNRYLIRPGLSEKSRKKALNWRKHYRFGKKSKAENHPFDPINMGDSINSKDPEYFPSLTIDGHRFIFTRKIDNQYENFFISYKKEGVWSKAQLLKGAFNKSIHGRFNRGAETISQDGKLLLLTICDRTDGAGSCDIYYSVHGEEGWSAAKNIGPPINSHFWDSQPSLSPDGKDLYFVSNRPGGFGGSDIYVTHLKDNGYWSKPENLGASINTSGDESSPFIHADNMTLYFASDGHPGIGGVDLFYVRKEITDDWGKPHNLGYPINTIDHDGSMFVAANGKTAFFASDRSDSRGALDLYRFELYSQARPVKTLYVQGNVFNAKTGNPISALVSLIDLKSGKELTNIKSDKKGDFLVTLPVGKDYAFNVSKKGFLFYSNHFSLSDSSKWQSYKVRIPLQPIAKDAHIILENVFFDVDKYKLRSGSFMELNKVVLLLKENPDIRIQINGYTDSTGSAAHNLTLSQNRAESVVNYLISKGIDKARLHAKGFGAKHPIAPNNTPAGRAKNRRTELKIL